jgi:hypothetical protein
VGRLLQLGEHILAGWIIVVVVADNLVDLSE